MDWKSRRTHAFCSTIFGPADGEGPELLDAVLLLEVVAAADALDAARLGGRVVDDHLHALDAAPPAAAQDLNADRAGGEDRDVAGERGVELVARLGLDDLEACVLGDGDAPRAAELALDDVRREGQDRHLGILASQQLGGAQADRPDAYDRRASALRSTTLRTRATAAADGGVRAVGVEHDRRAERVEEELLRGGEDRLAVADLRAPDPEGGAGQALRTAREHRALDDVGEVVGRDPGVGDDDVDLGVVGRDGVERAGVGVGVQLDQDPLHEGSSLRGSGKLRWPQSSGPSWR